MCPGLQRCILTDHTVHSRYDDHMDNWNLRTPADFVAAYALIRDAMAQAIISQDEAVHALALAGTRHLAGVEGQRLVLIGPSGSGKSTLARTLAEALGVPWRIIDVTMLAEQNWSGAQLTDHLDALQTEHGHNAARSVLVLDEIDKICVSEMERTSKDYRVGKQQTLLPLLGTGSELPIGGLKQFRPDALLIIMAGVFPQVTADRVSPADLLHVGLMSEIVERMGPVIRLHPLSKKVLAQVLSRTAERCVSAFRLLGYDLMVPDATISYLAAAVAADEAAGTRSGMSWLQASADAMLVSLLERQAPQGTCCTLYPDSLALPPAGKRRKRGESTGGDVGMGVG